LDFGWISRLALPNNQDPPTPTPKCPQVASVALDIRKPLGSPELRVRRRHDSSVPALVHVKETTMHVDDFPMAPKYDVRLPRKIRLVESVSVTEGVNDGTNYLFGFGVAISDSRHVEATLLRGENVGHSC